MNRGLVTLVEAWWHWFPALGLSRSKLLKRVKQKASCTTPVNQWNEGQIQGCNPTLLAVPNCSCYHKFTYEALGRVTAIKPVKLIETSYPLPHFLPRRECEHLTHTPLVCQMSKGTEIDEGANYSWKSQKGMGSIQCLYHEMSQRMNFPKLEKTLDSKDRAGKKDRACSIKNRPPLLQFRHLSCGLQQLKHTFFENCEIFQSFFFQNWRPMCNREI